MTTQRPTGLNLLALVWYRDRRAMLAPRPAVEFDTLGREGTHAIHQDNGARKRADLPSRSMPSQGSLRHPIDPHSRPRP